MIAVALPDVARSAPAALSNAEVLGTYIQVNGFDVETALLARAQARSTAARDLAARVAEDHLGVRQAAYALAVTCKASPVLPNNRTAAAVEHGRAMHDLAALSGAEFDRAYLKHEVAFHRAAIDAVRKVLLPATTCAALRAHFTDVLPAMEHHLAETERLANELTAR
jgi:putative membrane protein